MMAKLATLVLLLIARKLSLCSGFTAWATTQVRRHRHRHSHATTSIAAMPTVGPEFFEVNSELARKAFFIWFFGASGAAGIARSAFPRMYRSTMTIQSLKGVGPTLGGETIGISPLCFFPEDLAIKDVEQVVNNPLSVAEIVERHPIEGNFLAKKGYLTFEAFNLANEGANPLAIRGIFDTFNQSTNVCEPEIAQAKLTSYREDPTLLRGALLKSKVVGFFAVFTLLFLLGFADIVAAGHAYHGWFPDWPGGKNFPWSLFDPDGGLLSIPDYWI